MPRRQKARLDPVPPAIDDGRLMGDPVLSAQERIATA